MVQNNFYCTTETTEITTTLHYKIFVNNFCVYINSNLLFSRLESYYSTICFKCKGEQDDTAEHCDSGGSELVVESWRQWKQHWNHNEHSQLAQHRLGLSSQLQRLVLPWRPRDVRHTGQVSWCSRDVTVSASVHSVVLPPPPLLLLLAHHCFSPIIRLQSVKPQNIDFKL